MLTYVRQIDDRSYYIIEDGNLITVYRLDGHDEWEYKSTQLGGLDREHLAELILKETSFWNKMM
jgi:hypothetical protein